VARADLCEVFRVSPRQLDKDIREVRQAGLEVVKHQRVGCEGYAIEGSQPYGG
jgi:hypothetical protein